jgi:hypothetical protein
LAPRLRVDLTCTVTASTARSALERFETDVVDLSSSGCAIRASAAALPVGTAMAIELELAGQAVRFAGIVVRTWMSGSEPHAGVQFDPMPAATTQLLNRFLVEQLRADA